MAITDFTGAPRGRRADTREMQFLMLAIYPLCFAAAFLSRLLPRQWRSEGHDAAPRRSIFAEAGASASACIPFVFR